MILATLLMGKPACFPFHNVLLGAYMDLGRILESVNGETVGTRVRA